MAMKRALLRRRWRCGALPPRRGLALALGLVLLSLISALLLLLLLVALVSPTGRTGERMPPSCPILLGQQWGWESEGEGGEGGEEGAPTTAEGRNGSSAGKKRQQRHLYLHATWRTGSSFVGELFQQHPEVFYLYEPMWHLWQALYPGDALGLQGALRDMLRSLFRCDFSVFSLYAASASDPLWTTGPPLNLTTRSLFGWRTNKAVCSAPFCPGSPFSRERVGLVEGAECERRCPARALGDLEAECRRAPVVVIKDVRLLQLEALAPLLRDGGLDLRVVQLFRDPRAVHNSRLKAKQALLKESLQVLRSGGRNNRRGSHPQPKQQQQQQHFPFLFDGGHRQHPPPRTAESFLSGALEVICRGWLRDLLLARRGPPWLRPRYAQLRYEDLVRDPRGEARRLMAFAGLEAPPALQDFAFDMTRAPEGSDASDKPFLLSPRDARQALGAWKERLSRAQVRHVEGACQGAMRLLRYPNSPDPDRQHPG